ncbi:hypothetical protein [Mycolicibacterium fortuitum]|uniref:Intersectin-EH binding protein Ibp1 n=2 Tax=Mycolicibacterium fortuitum TaxID=1766 RepID=A0A378UDE2_MYCFO|nr:hypothetical protein [Mycolicibacterium fortuitum]AIY47153.1 hypothetical protein G155_18225 [Mycobacterium sp. VKM Ac-1817D]CRL77235.1 hypothetical protein CPGR_01953 [Mycolicibacter nonchromogenicus]EJZ09530.1 hypothetical protein MFORT_22205 [Mycolicibacterium fortuitum subsp. fortuitum DSM 46621 = ATCC 6841 = JCM 6387]MCA4722104.1 hypothetical protein [Mycolicibacterium fortuitum]MCA4753096.1 hypothetical protein [Mycolicibacterium fortuitum]
MLIRTRASELLLATLCSTMLAAAVLASAPAATSAPCPGGSTLDPTTGICWSENSPSNSLGGSGNIPCLPGRLGLCLGALQNTPVPGSALQTTYPPAGPAPRSGPKGTWP